MNQNVEFQEFDKDPWSYFIIMGTIQETHNSVNESDLFMKVLF